MTCQLLTAEVPHVANIQKVPVENASYLSHLGLRILLSCWVFCLGFSPWSTVWGQTDAEKAMRSFRKNSWYDANSKQLVPPKVHPADDDPLRKIGRTAPPPPVAPTNPQNNFWWDDVFKYFPNFTGLAQLVPTLLFWALGAVLLLVVGVLTYFAFRHYMPTFQQRKQDLTAIAIDPTRMVDLPFEVDETVDGHPLAQAERLMLSGDYDAAIVFLYGYLLLALDQSRKIHLQKGKTNRMYLRELRGFVPLQDIVQQAMLIFEACYFGKHSVSRTEFLAVWQRLDEFHQLLQASTTSPAPSLAETLT